MSKKSVVRKIDVFRNLFFAMALCTTGAAAQTPCDDAKNLAQHLEAGESYRGVQNAGETFYFTVDLPAAGLLAVDVLAPAAAGEAKLGLVGPACDSRQAQASPVTQRPDAAILSIPTAGSYSFRVAAQDPEQALDHFRIQTAFHQRANLTNLKSSDLCPLGCWPGNTNCPVDCQLPCPTCTPGSPGCHPTSCIEVCPQGCSSGLPGCPTVCVAASLVDEWDVDPEPLVASFPGGDESNDDGGNTDRVDEWDVDPEPLGGSPGQPADSALEGVLAGLRQAVCRGLVQDDHGDFSLCATTLEPSLGLRGEIRNAWGDDRDLFAFELQDKTTVDLRSHGTADLLGVLYTASGLRLAVADDGGPDGNFRLVRTLPAGRYLLAVEGARGSEGAYELSLNRLSW